MTENVFRPSRRVRGKRVLSRLYCGRYSLSRGEKPVTVALHTPDERVARKRLRDIIVKAQQEGEGMLPPKSVRDAAAAMLVELLGDYARHLKGSHLDEKHVHDTLARIQRVVADVGWDKLGHVTAHGFEKWLDGLKRSAKTRKEYQISFSAFLNWLVKTDRLLVNPLAKLSRIVTRGRQVRPYRVFTESELRQLLAAVSPERRMAYLTLLYTGQRMSEVAALVVEDLCLDLSEPFVRIREETTKDKDKRAVPLHPVLASELRVFVPRDAGRTDLVFPNFPSYDALVADFKRAGIEKKDGLGRSVHFHSFRKTWQTMGVRAGLSQRVAQDILGHSDPSLTANVYTDMPSVGTHSEIAKLPWVGNAQLHSLKSEKTDVIEQVRQKLREVLGMVNASGAEVITTKAVSQLAAAKWLPGLGSNQRPSD